MKATIYGYNQGENYLLVWQKKGEEKNARKRVDRGSILVALSCEYCVQGMLSYKGKWQNLRRQG